MSDSDHDQEAPAPAGSAGAADSSASPRGWLRGRRRPSTVVIVAVAVCVAVVAAVIAVDSTSHNAKPSKPAAEPVAPPFTLPSLRDPAQQVSLAAYRGQPVIVNFFASWCAPCQRETPLLVKFYSSTHAKVVIIGVDADDSAPAALKFLAAHQVAYPVAFESTPAVADAWGVSQIGIPETFFLDSRHRIAKRIFGDVTMQELTAGAALIDRNSGSLAAADATAGTHIGERS